jgi:hypothetical protein
MRKDEVRGTRVPKKKTKKKKENSAKRREGEKERDRTLDCGECAKNPR